MNNNNNVNVSKIKKMVKSKGFVTAICAIGVVLVLVIGYNLRIKEATQPVKVPVAARRLSPRHLITEEDIKYVDVPSGALSGDYFSRKESVLNAYVNYDTTIQEGSLFYRGAVVSKSELPDEALYNLEDGESLYYVTVNMLTSFTNSILPGRYIDLYISTREDDKALVGKFIQNIKVLQVKTSDGKNVFDNSQESRIPYVILFALPEEQHLLMKYITAINSYSISASNEGFSRIEISIRPSKEFYKDGDKEIKPTIASQYLKDYILNLAVEIPEDIEVPSISDTTHNAE